MNRQFGVASRPLWSILFSIKPSNLANSANSASESASFAIAPTPSATTAPLALTVQVAGPATGFPILALHGHPGRGISLQVFLDHLSDRYRVLAPDLRGYGHSRVSQPFTMADHLHDLEALLDQQGNSRCILLGWSLGGILALELTLKCPDRVQGLILIATAARPRSNHPRITWPDNLLTGLAAIANQIQPGAPWHIRAFGRRSLFRYLVQQQTPATYRWLARDAIGAYRQTSRYANQALHDALRSGYDRLPELAQITQPCLCLCGEQDRHITATATKETAAALPNSELHCYPQTAHLFPWEIPAQVNADLDRWLAQFTP